MNTVEDKMRTEYKSKYFGKGVRGKYHARYKKMGSDTIFSKQSRMFIVSDPISRHFP